jgi:hypothetical protein
LGLLALAFVIGLGKEVRGWRRNLRLDLARGVVELVIVDDADVALEMDNNTSSPVFAFELQGGKALALVGQWLWDARTYGAKPSDVIETDQRGNDLPQPWSFPSTAFTVHRLTASGEVWDRWHTRDREQLHRRSLVVSDGAAAPRRGAVELPP